MQKILSKIIIVIILSCLLTGCWLQNVSNFVIPDDEDFIETINRLDTPQKICTYMKENFEWEWTIRTYTPYQLWLVSRQNKYGDCSDYSAFAIFVAHYHGYEVFQMFMWKNRMPHVLGVFVENDKYTYSDNQYYHPIYVKTFREVIENHSSEFQSYKVYDYNMNIIERGKK